MKPWREPGLLPAGRVQHARVRLHLGNLARKLLLPPPGLSSPQRPCQLCPFRIAVMRIIAALANEALVGRRACIHSVLLTTAPPEVLVCSHGKLRPGHSGGLARSAEPLTDKAAPGQFSSFPPRALCCRPSSLSRADPAPSPWFLVGQDSMLKHFVPCLASHPHRACLWHPHQAWVLGMLSEGAGQAVSLPGECHQGTGPRG